MGEKPTDPYRFMVLCFDRETGKVLWERVAREEVPHEGIQPNNSYASIYVISGNNGVVTCLNTKSGAVNYQQERLEQLREVYASPVAAKDRVYVLGREGQCVVLKKGPSLQVLATNTIEDKTDASMALAGRELFIRGKQYLYCIAEK